MGKLLDNLFRKAGITYGKTRWLFKSYTGTEEEAIQSEYALGRHLALEISEKLEINPEKKINELIQSIAVKLYHWVSNKKREFSFMILHSPEINAFTLPGGFIFITNALIDICERDEDQIAFVMGHEMGHVIKGHALDRIVANSLIGVVSSIGPGRRMVGGLAKKTIAKLLYSTYSQDQEMEADMFGVRILDVAGYDPKAAISFILRLKKVGTDEDYFKSNKYFSSHPGSEKRIQNLRRFFCE